MTRNTAPNLIEKLAREYQRWDTVYHHGVYDPFHPDGYSLRLIRSHIESYKQQIEKEYPQYLTSEYYLRELPPEVDPNYMARADEIRVHARKSLELYEADPYLQYLRYHRNELSPKEVRESCFDYVINYAPNLEKAVREDDLVTMRIHENPNGYLQSFRECAMKVKEYLNNAEPNLFSLAAADEPGFKFPEEDQEKDPFSQSMV